MTFSASVSSEALTIVTDAGNLVIAAGDTRGANHSGVPFRLWVTNNGALDAQVYSGPGLATRRPFRPLGYLTWEAGLPIPGQWSANPTVEQPWLPGDPLPGDQLQQVQATSQARFQLNAGSSGNWTLTPLTQSIVLASAANLVGGEVFGTTGVWAYNQDVCAVGVFRNGAQCGLVSGNNANNISIDQPFNDFPAASGSVLYSVMIRSVLNKTIAFPYTLGIGDGASLTLTEVMG